MSRWPNVPLGELGADAPYACVGGPFGSNLTKRDYVDAPGVPVIRGCNLGEGEFIDDGFVYVSDEKAERLNQNQAQKGDVVFTQRGTIGQVATIPRDARHERYVISQSQMKLTPHPDRVDARFLVHYFRSPAALRHLDNATLATGVPHINLAILRQVPVPLPPVSEQRRIADILDKADAIRRKRKEVIAFTDDLLRSVFLDMFGDPVANPKGWEMRSLSELKVDFAYGTSTKCNEDTGGRGVLRIPNVVGGEVVLEGLKYADIDAKEAARFTLHKGDLLFVRTNGNANYIARCAVFALDEPMLFASYLIRARLPEGCPVSPQFVHAVFSSASFRAHLLKEATTTAGNYNINTKALGRQTVALPPRELQDRFASVVNQIRVLRRHAECSRVESDGLFGALVSRAFRGQLSSSDAAC